MSSFDSSVCLEMQYSNCDVNMINIIGKLHYILYGWMFLDYLAILLTNFMYATTANV